MLTITAVFAFILLAASARAEENKILGCAKAGNLACIKRLVKQDKSNLFARDGNGNTLLMVAAARGSNGIISYLGKTWADWQPNRFSENALHAAAKSNFTDTAKLLVSMAHGDPDVSFDSFLNARETQHGATPLHWAALRCNRALYVFLVKQGAKTNIADFNGNTPQKIFARCKEDTSAKPARKKTAAVKKASPAKAAAAKASAPTTRTVTKSF